MTREHAIKDIEKNIIPIERHYSRPNIYTDLYWHCPECGHDYLTLTDMRFCPNCGTKKKESRPKGHWIKEKMWSEGIGMGESYGFYYSCSECKTVVKGNYNECGKNFCPHCGANMQQPEEGNV